MNQSLEQLLALQDQIGLCWLGNLSWLIRAQRKLIATDLDLDRPNRLHPSPIPTAEIAEVLDVHFITHEHGDHFSEATSRILSDQSDCTFVVPANCVEKAEKIGIPGHRITVARPHHPFTIEGIEVAPQRALHGHTHFTVYRRANLDDYVFHLHNRKVFQPGDTVLLQEHLEDFGGVSVLFVSPTLHNMHLAASKTLIDTIAPDHIFPQHFGTYEPNEQNSYWTVGYPDELKASLSTELQDSFHKLEPGRVFTIDP
ncbi:MAG: MBL fold metallo-hydrolase [bacterium]|nr:MBL fold metallo-hydrolase [bacterium]